MINTSITEFIYIFRSQQVKSNLHRGLVQLAIGSVIFLLAILYYQSSLWWWWGLVQRPRFSSQLAGVLG